MLEESKLPANFVQKPLKSRGKLPRFLFRRCFVYFCYACPPKFVPLPHSTTTQTADRMNPPSKLTNRTSIWEALASPNNWVLEHTSSSTTGPAECAKRLNSPGQRPNGVSDLRHHGDGKREENNGAQASNLV